MPEYTVIHSTKYQYDEFVGRSHNLLYMSLSSNQHQECKGYKIDIHPKPAVFNHRSDYFGNQYFCFSVEKPHKRLDITITTSIKTLPEPPPVIHLSIPWETVIDKIRYSKNPDTFKIIEFTMDSPFIIRGSLFEDFARMTFTAQKPLFEAVNEFNTLIYKEFKYSPGVTHIYTPIADVLKTKKGVCQDFTHLAIVCLRSIGIPARYVSGYLETAPPPGKAKLRGSDATHAWFSVYFPEVGWIDFDPTNGKRITEEYIITAIGRDFSDVSPMKGVLYGGGKNKMKVEVDVLRV